jgi:Uri superfamily endonuclease
MKDHISVQGTYILLLQCNHEAELSIGKPGKMKTEPGYYLYVGSAFGPGGIQARVNHHMQIAERPHWHIDYLRTVVVLVNVWCVYGSRYEHEWARGLLQSDAAKVPLKGFGSSDCDCTTHLFYFEHKPTKAALEKLLNNRLATIEVYHPDFSQRRRARRGF